jgi:RNA polymerase sigma-70 factor (ECF subfamily)
MKPRHLQRRSSPQLVTKITLSNQKTTGIVEPLTVSWRMGLTTGRVAFCLPTANSSEIEKVQSRFSRQTACMYEPNSPLKSDWESLLTAARDGKEDALNEVWTRLRDYLLLMANDIGDELNGKFDASDIVQQSLLEAHEGFGRFRGTGETEIRAWLVRLVEHNLIDAGRRFRQTKQRDVRREHSINAYDHTSELPAPDKTASSLVRKKELDEELVRAVAQLPERSQQALELRHRQGLSHAEVATELGMTEQNARKLWSRTVEELRHLLTPRNAESPR